MQPVIVAGVDHFLDKSLWTPQAFERDFGKSCEQLAREAANRGGVVSHVNSQRGSQSRGCGKSCKQPEKRQPIKGVWHVYCTR